MISPSMCYGNCLPGLTAAFQIITVRPGVQGARIIGRLKLLRGGGSLLTLRSVLAFAPPRNTPSY
jgi:hypothetical protein